MKLALFRREPIDADRYVEDEDSRIQPAPGDYGLSVRNLDGVPWYDAPVPRRLHRCFAQTIGNESDLIGVVRTIERCACGSISIVDWRDLNRAVHMNNWAQRNSR